LGCDIHTYIEVYRRGRWVTVFGPRYKSARRSRRDDNDTAVTRGSPEGVRRDYFIPPSVPYTDQYKAPWDHPLYLRRNYGMFSILAGVRNAIDCEPIAHPRGLPEDASYNVRKEDKVWEHDGHTHSWFTLDELEAFNWDAVAWYEEERTGAGGPWKPGEFSAERQAFMVTSGKIGVNVGPGRLALVKALNEAAPDDPTVVKLTLTHWHMARTQVTYKEGARLHDEFLPALRKLAPNGDASKVRFVFWFDN